MARKFFKNISSVSIGGKTPGHVFQIPVDADGAPTELYWRKRLDDQSIAPHATASSAPVSSDPVDPAASPGAASPEAKKPSASKKGA